MHKSVVKGFSFLEMILVLAVIGLLGAFAVPNLFKNERTVERKKFLASFELLLKDAVIRSLVEHKVHQIYVDIEHACIQMREYHVGSVETNQHKQFKKVVDHDYVTEIPFPKDFVIRNFFINGIDEVVPGNKMLDVLFYIMPDGTSQPVTINCIDQDTDGIMPDISFSFIISPFYAKMLFYETFQKP